MTLQQLLVPLLTFWEKGNGKNSTKHDYFEEDYINGLPDEILASILSYLTVKEAVKTRVLSRRWRYIYLSHLHASGSNLNFDLLGLIGPSELQARSDCRPHTHALVENVNRFLNCYKGPNISSFRVALCLGRKFTSDIDRWITYAVKLDVEELELSCECNYMHRFFKSKQELHEFSFKILSEASKLKYLCLYSCILKPDFIGHLNSLKVLDLNRISLDQSLLLHTLSRCLNLERLKLSQCLCPAVLSIRSPFLRLKLLTVCYCEGLEEIELSAANLTHFEFFSVYVMVNIVISSVPNLEHVFCSLPRTTNISYFLNKMANSLPQLQTLSVRCNVELINSIPGSVSTFRNLKQLDFFLNTGNVHDIRKIIPVLIACPKLQKFCLMIRYIGPGLVHREKRTMGVLHKCIHTELKEVEIGGFQGTVNQLELAMYILENAVALERMVVSSRDRLYLGFGRWHLDLESAPWNESASWNESKRESIIQQLQGKATSKSAQLIIQ